MESFSTASLFASLVVGAIGLGYFIYGKRQANGAVLLCGIAMMVGPMFIASWWAIALLGGVLMLLPRWLPS